MSKERLRSFINSTATELVVAAVILASVGLTIGEVCTARGGWADLICFWGTVGVTVLFVIELSIRWYVARSTRHFLREYWLDVLATALPTVRALRVLRVLRLLRLIRVGMMVSRRTRRFTFALYEGFAEHIIVLAILGALVLIGAVGIGLAEPKNPAAEDLGSALWWSFLTMITGNSPAAPPSTFVGRLLMVMVIFGGMTLFAMFTGVISAIMVERLRGGVDAKEMELDELRDHVVICGWNRAAPAIIHELQDCPQTAAVPIVVIAELDETPPILALEGGTGLTFFIRGDFTSSSVLIKARTTCAAAVIVLADKSKPRSEQDRDARTILTALTVEKLDPSRNIHTCVELLNRDPQKIEVLRLAQVEDIVVGDEYLGNVMAHTSRACGLAHLLHELLTVGEGNALYKLRVPEPFVGESYGRALPALKQQFDVLVIAVETASIEGYPGLGRRDALGVVLTEGGRRYYVTNPPAEYRLQAADCLFVVARPAGVVAQLGRYVVGSRRLTGTGAAPMSVSG